MVLERLSGTFRRIIGLSKFDKEEVEAVLRDVQRTLISADVDLELVAELTDRVRKRVLEGKPEPGMTLKELFVKTLYDEIVSILGEGKQPGLKPQKILVIGLFGSGKTTTIGKLAKWFKSRGLSVGVVGCDLHRPAAQAQLKQIAEKVGASVYLEGKDPVDIAKRALKAKEDVLIFDSAGRDSLDRKLAQELKELEKVIKPDEVWLVIPAELGQAAKKQTQGFQKLVGITGIIITRMDGTAKGGGALTAAKLTGAKVVFLGTGEKLEDLESYEPKRFVARLIGWGDLEGLLERAKLAGIEPKKEIELERFTLNDFYEQIKNMQKLGSLDRIVQHLPGFGMLKLPKDLLSVQEEKLKRWSYAIQSMTPEERENPEIIRGSRIRRISKGSGVPESEIRELLKYYKQIKKLLKQLGGKKLKRGILGRFGKLWQGMNV
ncbi:MAG: signal recognition particle protein [Candidatus Aenigmatarchaeota archaeon]|nr:MAG: signal recognition particle protein [Candidatus Aenigmarchaeota archaeon]